jgi:hypothetical protein
VDYISRVLSKAQFTVLRASGGVEAIAFMTSILAMSGAFNDNMLPTAELLGADASLRNRSSAHLRTSR